MSIQTAYEEVVAEIATRAPRSKALPTVRCNLVPGGVECIAELSLNGQSYTTPAALGWEDALVFLLGVMRGQTERLDYLVERKRQARIKAEAESIALEAEAEITRIDALLATQAEPVEEPIEAPVEPPLEG